MTSRDEKDPWIDGEALSSHTSKAGGEAWRDLLRREKEKAKRGGGLHEAAGFPIENFLQRAQWCQFSTRGDFILGGTNHIRRYA